MDRMIYAIAMMFVAVASYGFMSVDHIEQAENHVDYWIDHQDEARELPPKNLGNEVLYQVFLDRFANGNTDNDCMHQGRYCDASRRDWYRYWGGDVRGLIDRMPYLKRLGVTRVWLTPIFDNTDVTVARHRHGEDVKVTSYHGYWIRDWFRLNPYFTDAGVEDFAIVRELVDAAGPEIGIYLDTVANHTAPSDATAESLSYLDSTDPLGTTADGFERSHRGVLFEEGRYLMSIGEDEARARAENNWDRWFHRYGPIRDYNDLYQVEHFQLDGLSDLDQTHPEVHRYMDRAHAFWMEQVPGLAGYRMDTIKHINQSYWERFDQDFFSAFPDKEIVGEYYGAGPYNQDSYDFYNKTRQSMFDFDFRYALFSVFKEDAHMNTFSRLWARDDQLIDARAMITFIDNHDVPRVRGLGMSNQRMKQAVAVLMMARGIPCIYYGLEQDLFHPGDPGDPYNRPMMTSFDENSEYFQLVSKLTALRSRNDALRYGSTHVIHESRHILAFERVYEGRKALLVTSKNPIAGADEFSLQNVTLPDGSYRDIISGRTLEVIRGRLPIAIRNGQTIILSTH